MRADKRAAAESTRPRLKPEPLPKPLLRGWSHAVAAAGAVAVTVALVLQTVHDLPRFVAVLIFGLSMTVLYAVSATYHIGSWEGRRRQFLRALDHANIFVVIAGTYTPICVMLLDGRLRVTMLTLIWSLAAVGTALTVITMRLPRWIATSLYVGMGLVGIPLLPYLLQALPMTAISLMIAGGVVYIIGGIIYALQRPNPLPRFFGFHEIFHLLVITGSTLFIILIWGWVLPYSRG